MLDRLRALLNRPRTAEDDVEPDTHVARTRETGGAPDDTGDRASTTGTGPTEDYVGRISGQDPGYRRGDGGRTPRQPLTAGEPLGPPCPPEIRSRADAHTTRTGRDRRDPHGVHGSATAPGGREMRRWPYADWPEVSSCFRYV